MPTKQLIVCFIVTFVVLRIICKKILRSTDCYLDSETILNCKSLPFVIGVGITLLYWFIWYMKKYGF